MTFGPTTGAERHKICKSPVESKITNFLGGNAWIETAFKVVGFMPSVTSLLNATKQAPPSPESWLHLTDLCFTVS